jgi:hypothetical protein
VTTKHLLGDVALQPSLDARGDAFLRRVGDAVLPDLGEPAVDERHHLGRVRLRVEELG